MVTFEERVAYLEGKVEEHSQAFPAIRDAIGRLEERVDRLAERMDHLADRMDRRFEALDDKVSKQFIWMIGIQVTILIAIVGAVLSRA